MRADITITIWHFEDDLHSPVRTVYKGVHLDYTRKILKNGIKQKGFYDGDCCVARIPIKKEIGVVPGDYLTVEESDEEMPNPDNSMKIIEVKDNRRGGQPHWKIICGG